MMEIKQQLTGFAKLVRRLTDDDAYERYLEHHHRHHANQPLLDRRAFYLAEQQRKWNGIKRCC